MYSYKTVSMTQTMVQNMQPNISNLQYLQSSNTFAQNVQQYMQSMQLPFDINLYINHRPFRNEWSVQFANNRQWLSNYQIHYIFSAYGTINSVHHSNSTEHIVYINYGSEWEAKRCVIGLFTSQTQIILRPFSKSGVNNSHYFNKNLNPSNHISAGSFPAKSDATQASEVNTGIVTHEESSVESEPVDQSSSESGSWDEGSERHKYRMAKGVQICEVLEERMKEGAEAGKNTKREVNTQANKKVEDVTTNDTSNSDEIIQKTVDELLKQYSMNDEIFQESDEEKPEEKSAEQQKTKPAEKRQIIEAQEIIVANVHEDYGIFFILHLLQKYEPIHITEMRTLRKHSIRYCHVYFKTMDDAEAAETDFDKVILEGRPLIVMRPHTLAEEAMRCNK